MREFQQANEGLVLITLSAVDLGTGPAMTARADIWPVNVDPQVVEPYASVSVVCSVLGRQTLEVAIFRLLYALDFRLAVLAEQRVSGE
jgi:hypothetical protein